jgi:hypothetical protein
MSPTQKGVLAIEKLDLASIMDKLRTKDGFDVRRAEHTVRQYRQFLKMALKNPNNIMVPNEDVDIAWHHHILDTQAYIRDSFAIFGQYLHHNPNFYGTDAFFEACETTKKLFQNEYGTADFLNTDALKPSKCGGPSLMNGDRKPSACGGMLKDDVEMGPNKPSACGGMLKDDAEMGPNKPSACGGMLKDDVEMGPNKPSACGGMLKDDETVALAPHAHNDGFKPYIDNVHH